MSATDLQQQPASLIDKIEKDFDLPIDKTLNSLLMF